LRVAESSSFGYLNGSSSIQKAEMNRPNFFSIPLVVALTGILSAQNPPTSSTSTLTDVVPGLAAVGNHAAPLPYDPLLDPPPLPKKRVTLIGGTVTKLNSVQDEMTVRPFGNGKQMHIVFDTRTSFVRNGAPAQQRDLHQGDRIYLDTMLNGTQIFAKKIWIQAEAPTGDGRGQVVDYDTRAGLLTVRDELSQQPARFRLTPTTVVKDGTQTKPASELAPGTLVSLTFGPQQDRYGTVREISVLARPGTAYSFFGKITFLDLANRVIAIDNNADGKNYEIHLEDVPQGSLRTLRQGSEVGISAVFDGHQYVASSIAAAAPKASTDQDQDK